MSFIKTIIQEKAIKLFTSGKSKFLLYGGSRCFAKGTLVQTDKGHIPIELIKVDDNVLSFNPISKEKSYKKVLKTFHNTAVHKKQMIIFELRNGSQIECTEHHELYFKGIWRSAAGLAKRAMEANKWLRKSVFNKQFRQAKNVWVERLERCEDIKTSIGWEWLSEDYDLERWQNKNSEDSQISSRGLYSKSRQQATGESHRPQQAEQLCIESGMVYTSRKYRPLRKFWSSIKKQWREKWMRKNNRAASYRDKAEVQTENIHQRNVSKRIWPKSVHNKRYNSSQKLESREIDLDEIIAISFYSANIETFDLCVEDNHNYTVTKDNIIVHNSGKSFIIVFAQIVIACKFPGSRHLVCRFRFNHVKNSIWMDTLKKVLKVCFPQLVVKWNNADYFITLPNGSEIWIGGLDDKERSEKILGMEFLTIFVNEASQISYEAYTTLLTRLAQQIDGARNLLFIDENPPSKKHWTYKIFFGHVEPETNVSLSYIDQYGHLHMNPADNVQNISKDYMELLESLPARKKKRFLKGEFADETEGALWTDELINGGRLPYSSSWSLESKAPVYERIVIAIDPAVTSKDTSDETGIVVTAKGYDGHLYVLEDQSDIYTPSDWAKKAVSLYRKYKADRIIGEVNNGGDLIEAVIRQVDDNVSYKSVHATRDKLTRAEPVAALYEQGKAHHIGELSELELEMTSWSAKAGEKSPNRIDALVWGATELILDSVAEWSW